MCRLPFYLSLSLIFLLLFSSPVTLFLSYQYCCKHVECAYQWLSCAQSPRWALHRIVIIKASTFCPSEDIFAMTPAHRLSDKVQAFICTEASLYGDGELQRHLHSLLSCSTCGEGRTAFCSSTMIPFCFSTACQMWFLYIGETGKVTLAAVDWDFPWCLCWPLKWANLEMPIPCHCYRTPAVVCASTQRSQAW